MTEAEVIAGRRTHATEGEESPERTLCGQRVAACSPWVSFTVIRAAPLKIDNAMPTCRRCLAVIRRRTRGDKARR